jgi:hypothetical protein
LNKLTVEKFTQLSSQLLDIKYGCTAHIAILIKEIFEKATMQHHFMQMYADLCERLNTFFTENPVSQNKNEGFKKLLLNECQNSFERNLTPPTTFDQLDLDERTIIEVKYKTRMLGNIRFVGALLARKMLASKVLISILEELMGDKTPEALESVAALLTVTGPAFDTPDWANRPALNAVFFQLKDIVKKKACCARVRCVLQDLLDLRARGWEDSRPKKVEGPTTLQAVADKKTLDDTGKASPSAANDAWTKVGGARMTPIARFG